MEVLFVGFYGDTGRRVVEESCKTCNITAFTLIGDEDIQVPGVRCRFLNKGFFRNAQITVSDIEGRAAIDSPLCEQMQAIELEFYQQCERLNRKYEFSSFDARREFYLRSLIYFNDLLESSAFDRIVMSNVPHLGYDTVIYGLAKTKKIPVQFFYRLPIITDKFFYLYSEGDWKNHRREDMVKHLVEFERKTDLEKKSEFKRLRSQLEAWDEIVCRKQHRSAKSGEKNIHGKIKDTIVKAIAWMFSCWRFTPHKRVIEIGDTLTYERSRLDKIERKVSGNFLIRYYDRLAKLPDSSQKYVYFPLHKQPEATTSPLGGIYQDQRLAIRLLSQVLPEGWKIYVKEFPLQRESHRCKAIYDELISLGNVDLINRRVDSLELVAGAEFTATVTGTAAWESFFMGKPAVLFGYSILTATKGVFDVKSEVEVRNAIKNICEGIEIQDSDKLGFIYALEQVCFKGYLEPYKAAVKTARYSPEENTSAIVREVSAFLGGKLPSY